MKLVDGAPVLSGSPSWQGGTPVERDGHADGDGVFARWEYAHGSVRITTDRLGFFPLYYFSTRDEFCVSPSLVTLLDEGAPRTVDDDALAVFLRTGWFIADDTAFAAIRAVPACRAFEWSNGNLRIERAVREPQELSITFEDARDRYIELFRAAVERRLVPDGEPFTMPLSGGADSRHILLELVRQGRAPDALVTAAQRPRCPDVAVARRIAAQLGIAHTVVNGAMDAGWADELHKNLQTNFCADEHAWFLPVAQHLLARTRFSYDGIAGDILSANADLKEAVMVGTRAGRVDELLDDLLYDTHDERVLREALTPELYRRVPEATARDRIAEAIRPHLAVPNSWASFHFANWDRREISLNAHATLSPLHVHTPFLDRDVVDFLTSLPPELLFGGRFHAETIATAYPDLAGMPFAKQLPVSPLFNAATKVRRLPAHVVLQVHAHAMGPRSSFVRALPPVLRHPATPGGLGAFNARAVWLRQLELLISGDLDRR